MTDILICKKEEVKYPSVYCPDDRPYLKIQIEDKVSYLYVWDKNHNWFIENDISYEITERDDSYYLTFKTLEDTILFKLTWCNE